MSDLAEKNKRKKLEFCNFISFFSKRIKKAGRKSPASCLIFLYRDRIFVDIASPMYKAARPRATGDSDTQR
jgi:hypothetical protein